MKKWIGKILVTLLGLALLVYSATRSIDFISLTLPPDRQVLAYFGLAALDGGIIVWLLAFMYGSHGGAQRGISLMMILVDFLGAVAMFTADTIFNTGKAGLTTAFDQDQMMTFVLVLSIIIALNIGAGLAHHLTDPDHMRKMADEEAYSKIEDNARDRVSKESESLAAELAPVIAEAWITETRAKYMNAIKKAGGSLPANIIDAQAQDVAPHPTSNGKVNGKVKRPIFAFPLRRRPGSNGVTYNATAEPIAARLTIPHDDHCPYCRKGIEHTQEEHDEWIAYTVNPTLPGNGK
jgi:hypothetical protein